MSQLVSDITAGVRDQYEAYPYPDYSLFIPLRTQEAYASSSLFASRISAQNQGPSVLWKETRPRIFIAGCGDIFPYMLSHWEPRSHHLISWDLSRASIRRARLRSLFRLRPMEWQVADLENEKQALPQGLAHIDSFGVLHHLANPRRTIDRLYSQLLPGGTARIMVYNSAARSWIHQLQRAFALLDLSRFSRHDLDHAQKILEHLIRISPPLSDRLTPMRAGILGHSARLVDTFFHAREARLSFSYWNSAFRDAGFQPLALMDRYAELDDLPNPLLEFPCEEELQARIDDRRFENNFEFYLTKPGSSPVTAETSRPFPSLQRFRSPPLALFSYSETQGLGWRDRRRLWSHFLDRLSGRPTKALDRFLGKFPAPSLQRLARLGLLFPDDFESQGLRTLLRIPMHSEMEAPHFSEAVTLRSDGRLRSLVERVLSEKGLGFQRMDLVLKRIEAAQRP